MQIGIIGMPLVGKTTLFELLTGRKHNLCQTKTNAAIAQVPDPRVDFLNRLFKPKKTSYVQIEMIDIPGLVPGNDKGTRVFLDHIRKADALIHVVSAFNDSMESEDRLHTLEDIKNINIELLLAYLDLVEKRIQRIKEGKKKGQSLNEILLLEKIQEHLSNENIISELSLSHEEEQMLQSYQFLTDKPLMLCINLDVSNLKNREYEDRDKILEFAKQKNIPLVEIAVNMEKEIQELEEEEKTEFMEDLDLKEPGTSKICRGIFNSLEYISFFTVGEDEVKAWPLKKGATAKTAAGKVHSDMEKGFIRAEVVAYDDLFQYKTIAAAREKGLYRLEGKEYLVHDGDIINFRFNI